MPHWRKEVSKDNPNLHHWDIEGVSPIELTIEDCFSGEVFDSEVNEKKPMFFLRFRGAKKPLGLNVSNAYIIESMYGSDFTKWFDKKVILRTARCMGQDCIRVHMPEGTKLSKRKVKPFEFTDQFKPAPKGSA